MNKSEKKIFELYKKLNIGEASSCMTCRKQNHNLSAPISIWQVGNEYYDSQYRVLFVGKTARGEAGIKCGSFMDATKAADELYDNVGWAYWNYTKAITNSLYSEAAWEKVAFTNMVKCNNSDTVDTATDSMKNFCLPIFREEIKILQPKNIVFYTKDGYDEQIKILFDVITHSKFEDVNIGQKKMNSWTFEGIIENNKSRVIRVGHPERMKKDDYVKHITEYIRTV